MTRLLHVFHNRDHDAHFTMRAVANGDRYGKDMCLTHDADDPLIEFYDRRWDHDRDPEGEALGQFVSRYRLSTLLEPDAQGETAFDRGLMLDAGAAWSVSATGMRSCLDALRDAGLAPPDPEEAHEERAAELTEKIDAEMRARLDYAETHKDAGDAYTHLPREGGWSYSNGDDRLAGYMRRTGVDAKGLGIEEVSDLVLDNFRMEPGTIIDPTHGRDDLFLVDSFPVTEIEEQIYLSDLDKDATDAEWAEAKGRAEAHFSDNDMAYMTSDRVWYAVIDRETIEDLIADRAHEPDGMEL